MTDEQLMRLAHSYFKEMMEDGLKPADVATVIASMMAFAAFAGADDDKADKVVDRVAQQAKAFRSTLMQKYGGH